MIRGEIRVKHTPPRLCFVPHSCLLSVSPAVGKVSKPRRGHPLVESVIVTSVGRGLFEIGLFKIGNRQIRSYSCMHMTHQRVGQAKCARYDPCLGYPGDLPYIL